MNCSIF